MNNRAVTLSIAMAIMAIFFMQSYVSSIEEEAKKKFGTEVQVVVAAKDIREMATLNETHLELKSVPKRFLEPAAISFSDTPEDEASEEMKELAGGVAIVPIKKGEQITYNKLTEPSLRTGLSPQITPGRRAVSIPVTETTGVSKLVKPGDRIDLIAVMPMGVGQNAIISKTVLQDVAVLSVGRYVTNNIPRLVEEPDRRGREVVRSLASFDGFSSVTIEVEPEQAQKIALITSNPRNQIIVSLRNNDDTNRVQEKTLTLKDVLGKDAGRLNSRNPRGRNSRRRN